MPDNRLKCIRTEILPGLTLNSVRSDKFKTSCMSISLLTQLSAETASMNALIPYVLRRGTAHFDNMEALSNRLDELYGTVIEPVIRRIGEIQCIGFFSSFPEAAWLPEGSGVLKDVVSLLAEMLLSPATRGGLLIRDYVDSEKEKLADLIRSRINDKRLYAKVRCLEEMCCYEDVAVGRLGSAEDCASIKYKKLTQQYHNLLQTSPVEIFYCGRESAETVSALLKEAFCTMPRGELNYDIGTDIRMNSLDAEPRYHEDHLDVTQGKLVLGYRLGEIMENPDLPALMVFNAVYGSGVTSKLFNNVREKLSLCYYASSSLDRAKGLMFVNSGIEFDNFEIAKDEIIRQLDDVKNGVISDDELNWAKAGIISDLSSMLDSQYELEGFYFTNLVEGLEISPDELSYLVGEVTKEDVMAVAQSTELDMIYFLRNDPDGESDEDDE